MINKGFVENKERPLVSFCVCTYNPIWEKLKKTVDSLVCQKGVDFEIVVTDDGSDNNLFQELEEYFCEAGFKNYRLTAFESNKGTTWNVYNGLKHCNGIYVKLISPGDYIPVDEVVKDWVEFLIQSGRRWSFADVISYSLIDGEDKVISTLAHPQLTGLYKKDKDSVSRWNYVVLNDIAIGAAIISELELTLKYIELILDKIKYAEDNIYRLMMFLGDVGIYYGHNVVCYEVGTGVSTSGESKWSRRLSKDWKTTNEIMLRESDKDDRFQRKMIHSIRIMETARGRKSFIYKMLFIKNYFFWYIKRGIFPRMTDNI